MSFEDGNKCSLNLAQLSSTSSYSHPLIVNFSSRSQIMFQTQMLRANYMRNKIMLMNYIYIIQTCQIVQSKMGYYCFFCALIESKPLILPSEQSRQIKSSHVLCTHFAQNKCAKRAYATGHLISARCARRSGIPSSLSLPICEDKEKGECGCKGGPWEEFLVVASDWFAAH